MRRINFHYITKLIVKSNISLEIAANKPFSYHTCAKLTTMLVYGR